MYDKILAVVSLGLFLAFLGVLFIWVDALDLKIVLGVTVGMAAYDFWLDAFRSKPSGDK